MSAKLSGQVWEMDVPRAEKIVLLALADHGKHDGTDIRPSIALIMYKTGYEERQVQDVIATLVKKKVLVLVRRGGSGPGSTNEYRMDVSQAKFMPSFEDWKAARKGAKTAPLPFYMGAVSDEKGCNYQQIRVHPSALEPKALEPKEPRTSTGTPNVVPDGRFTPVKNHITNLWLKANRGIPTAPWDASEAAALARLLKSNPSWTEEIIIKAITHRFASERNHAERPRKWLRDTASYISGPLDKFNRPRSRAAVYGDIPEIGEGKKGA